MDQGAGQGHALLLPTGQGRRPFLGAVRQAHGFQSLQGLGAPVALEPEPDVIDDLFPGQQARLLEHQPGVFNGSAQGRGTGQQFASTGLVETGQQAQQGTFAAAAAPHHRHELAGGNVQVDFPQHLPRAEGLLQFAHRQGNALQQPRRLLSRHWAPPLAT